MTDDLITRLTDELSPGDDAVARMRARVAAELELEPAPGASLRAATTPRRRRLPSVRVGLAFAGAAAVALAVALSPFESTSDRRGVPAPATAQAALERAADAAGAVDWSPLVAGEYHHTMTTTFTPEVPTRAGDPRTKIDQMFSFAPPSSKEAWLDIDGRGLVLRTTGGNGDPDMFPTVHAGSRGGGVGSQPTFGRRYPERETVDVATSLRLADSLGVEAWRRGDTHPSSAQWFRTVRGYERRSFHSGPTPYVPGGDFGAFAQLQTWSATSEDVAAVNGAAPSELADAIERLLDEPSDGISHTVPPRGMYGVTRAEVEEEQRVLRAVDLLGSAPLSPAARRALFEWLSERPHAKLAGTTTDAAGRTGTEVVIERIEDRTAPGYTVTEDQLRREYARSWSGQMPRGDVRGPERIVVKPDHQYRRWYMSIVFDPDSGELLQHVVYARQESTAQRPRLQRNTIRGTGPQPAWRIAMGVDRQGMSDAVLYGVRERTAAIDNVQTAACSTTPAMCR